MNLDNIRIFTKVVEAGSFTRAAAQLSIPKSTVSRRVSELEDALGIRLLQRTTRKLNLTDAGRLYFSRTAQLLSELQETEVALSRLQAEPQGILRITTPGDLAGTLPDLLAHFQETYPKVEVIVFNTGRRVDLVAEGYDLALRAGTLADSSLVFKRLYRTHLSLYASPRYVKEHEPIRSLSDLSRHNCLIFSVDQLTAQWELYGPRGSERVEVSGRLASKDFTLLRGAAVQHQGIAFMPNFGAQTYLEAGSLVRVLPDYKSQESSLYAVYPSARLLAPKVRAFIDFASNWTKSRLLAL